MTRLLLLLLLLPPAAGAPGGRGKKKIAVYYSGWQLVGQRSDQPTAGDSRNETRVRSLVLRGFTHVMMEDGNMVVGGEVEPLDTLRFLGERGLASYMNVGWSLHTFYMDPLQQPAAVRRQYSPFVNRTQYRSKLDQIERIMRAASPWLAGVMNDLEFSPWLSAFPDLDERLGNRPSASAPEWPSFTGTGRRPGPTRSRRARNNGRSRRSCTTCPAGRTTMAAAGTARRRARAVWPGCVWRVPLAAAAAAARPPRWLRNCSGRRRRHWPGSIFGCG
jgi:hypothetical protein